MAKFHSKQLVLGDATDSSLYPSAIFNLVITSPPYNIGMEYTKDYDDSKDYEYYLDFSRKWLSNCYLWSAPYGRLCVNIPLDKNKGGQQPIYKDIISIAQSVGWKYHTTIVWNSGNISRRTAWGSWLRPSAPYVIAPVETIVVLYKGDAWKRPHLGNGRVTIEREEFIEWTLGLWDFKGESAKRIGHPAPFPLELPKRCIRLFSYVGDWVLDPFAGSGTTLIAALRDNRKAYGIEISKEYYDLAINRIDREIKE